MDFLVKFEETFSGLVRIEADSRDEANNILCSLVDSKKLVPSREYDTHVLNVHFIDEKKNKEIVDVLDRKYAVKNDSVLNVGVSHD